MNLWKSIFGEELRRGRFFLPLFLLLKGILLKNYLSQFSKVDDTNLDGYFPASVYYQTAVYLLIAVFVIRSLWLDSPMRRGSHLAFRPLRFRTIAWAKFSAILILIVVPSMAFEGLLLYFTDFTTSTVFFGALQNGIEMVIFVLTLFWIGLLWKNAFAAVCDSLLVVATFLYILSAGKLSFGQFTFLLGRDISSGIYHHLWALAIGLAALIFIFAHRRRRINRWVRAFAVPTFVFVGYVVSACTFAYFVPKRLEAVSDSAQRQKVLPSPSIVHKRISAYSSQRTGSLPSKNIQVVIAPSMVPLPPNEQVEWDFVRPSKLSTDGNQYQPSRQSSSSFAVFNVLAKHLKNKIAVSGGIGLDHSVPASGIFPLSFGSDDSADSQVNLGGKILRWKIIEDRSITSSEVKSGIIKEQSCPLWITGDFYGLSQSANTTLMIYSPGSGNIEPLWSRRRLRLSPLSCTLYTGDSSGKPGYPNNARILTLAPETIGALSTTWKSPAPLIIRKRDPIHDPMIAPGFPPRSTFEKFLAAYPPPPPGAPSEAMTMWLQDFLPKIPAADGENHPTTNEIIVSIANSHPIELLDAVNNMSDRDFFARVTTKEALGKSLLGEAILRHGGISTSEERGPLQPSDLAMAEILGPYVARKTRSGESYDIEEILFSVPEAAKLSIQEWIDLFRLIPSARCYEALRRVGVPEHQLHIETARFLEFRFPLPPKVVGAVPDVELALASGHPRAPEWYLTCFRSITEDGGINLPSFDARGSTIFRYADESIKKYFALPDEISKTERLPLINWFKTQNSADFVFDPAIRKFRLK